MSNDGILRTVPANAEENYVRNCRIGKWRCPCCGSDSLDWDGLDAQDSQVVQAVVCGDCGLEWTDVYNIAEVKIKGFDRIKKPAVQ